MITNMAIGRCIRTYKALTLWEGNDMRYRVYLGDVRLCSVTSLADAHTLFEQHKEEYYE